MENNLLEVFNSNFLEIVLNEGSGNQTSRTTVRDIEKRSVDNIFDISEDQLLKKLLDNFSKKSSEISIFNAKNNTYNNFDELGLKFGKSCLCSWKMDLSTFERIFITSEHCGYRKYISEGNEFKVCCKNIACNKVCCDIFFDVDIYHQNGTVSCTLIDLSWSQIPKNMQIDILQSFCKVIGSSDWLL